MPKKKPPLWLNEQLSPDIYKRWRLSFEGWDGLGPKYRSHNLVCYFLEKYPEVQDRYKANEPGYMYFDILAAAELEVLDQSDYEVESHLLELIDNA